MKITRLHIILAGIIVLITGMYVFQIQQTRETKALNELRAVSQQQQPQVVKQQPALQKTQQPQEKPVIIAEKKQLAIDAIAVAGEYWLMGKKKKMDVEKGQVTLRTAKQALENESFQEAWQLARQSIEEFKSAKPLKLFYTVKRGDCLWKIAKMPRHYGNGKYWPRIFKANSDKIKNSRLIFPKQVFFIPQ